MKNLYVIENALRNVGKNKGRNILQGVCHAIGHAGATVYVRMDGPLKKRYQLNAR